MDLFALDLGNISDFAVPSKLLLYPHIQISCAADYYGNCTVYCVDGPTFTCDPVTGIRVCNPGWSGPNCLTSRCCIMSGSQVFVTFKSQKYNFLNFLMSLIILTQIHVMALTADFKRVT